MVEIDKLPDALIVWAEVDGIMKIVGERVRQSNGKLKVKWRFQQKVLEQKIMYLEQK